MLVVGCIRALGELDLDLEVVEAGAVYKSPVGLEFVIRPPLEAGPCPGSGRSNAHG